MKSVFSASTLIEKTSGWAFPSFRRNFSKINVSNRDKSILFPLIFVGLVLSSPMLFAAEKAVTSPAGLKSTAPDSKKIFAQAQEFFAKKQYAEVKKLLTPILDQLDQQRLSLLSQSHFELAEYYEASRVAQLMISRNEKDETAFTLAGRAELKLKKEKEALEHFKKALELNPKYEPAYRSLVELYDKRKNYYELAILFNEMITRMGEKSEYLNRLCEVHTLDELYDQALKYCKRAIAKDPQFADNHVYIGIIYRNQKEDEKADIELKKAADQFTKSALAQSTYGQFLDSKKNYLASYKYFSNCVQLDEKNESCLLGHGYSSAQIMKYEESLASLKKSCALNRKNAVTVRKILQQLRTEKKTEWIPKYEALVEKCLAV